MQGIDWLEKYGKNIADVIVGYGDDAVRILIEHGDEATALISKHGNIAAKAIIDYGDEAIEDFKNGKTPAEIRAACESGKYTVSQTKIEHVLKNHTFGRLKETIDVLIEKGLIETAENLLNEKSFFNPEWSEKKVTEVVNYVYNEAVLKGITNENYTTIVSGEKITVCFQDGQFHTAYGEYKFSLSDFGY